MNFNNFILKICLLFCFFSNLEVLYAQVGLGTNAPIASAILDLESTTQGFLPPRMTQAQMASIASPVEALVVYCTDCVPQPGPYYYDGANFVHFVTGTMPSVLSSLDCSSAVDTGSMLQLNPNSGVQTAVPYVASALGQYNGISVASTGVVGLTATSIPGTFTSSGVINFYINGTPQGSGTASFAVALAGQSCTFTRNVVPIPIVASINCNSMSFPTFLRGVTVSHPISLAYTGGNGQSYASFSTNTVNGLRIDFNAGTLNNGSGTFVGTLSGTPTSVLLSSFTISFGQLATSCNRSFQVFDSIAGVVYLAVIDRATTNSDIQSDLAALGKIKADLISLADLNTIRTDSRYDTSAEIESHFGLSLPAGGVSWRLIANDPTNGSRVNVSTAIGRGTYGTPSAFNVSSLAGSTGTPSYKVYFFKS